MNNNHFSQSNFLNFLCEVAITVFVIVPVSIVLSVLAFNILAP